MYFIERILDDIKQGLEQLFPDEKNIISVKRTTDPNFGDFYTNIAFILAKNKKRNPNEIANEIKNNLTVKGVNIDVVKGFVNFKLDPCFFVDKVIEEVLENNDYAFSNEGRGRLVVIEHTSANPNKPLHLGHVRCAVIGDSLVRLYKAFGHDVDTQFYVNDLGRQVAESFYGWKYLKNKETKKEKFDWFLGEIYTYVHNNVEEDKIDEVLRKIEDIGSEDYEDLRKMVELCLECQLKSLEQLGICFDRLVFESDLVRCSVFEETKNLLIEKGYLVLVSEEDKIKIKKQGKYLDPSEYKGCYILKLEDFGFDDLVFIRSNGVATYTARDIAYALWKLGIIKDKIKFRKKDYVFVSGLEGENFIINNPYMAISVIANEQDYAQGIVKTTIGIIDPDKAKKYIHIPFGLVQRKDVKLSSRKGTWKGFTIYDIFELLDNVLKDSIPDKVKRRSIVSSVIRYELLKYEQKENIKIDPKEMTDINGNTAIYLLYAYVRAVNILNKMENFKPETRIYEKIKNEKESIELVKKFSFLPLVLKNSLKENSVKPICDYMFEISRLFNHWYTLYPVVKENSLARATIVLCFKKILENLFGIIGIKPVDRL